MALIDLDQNTQEWLEMRKRFIGGSDVPTIMCVSPWRTPLQLWEEKLTICSPDHAKKAFIFARGHAFEIVARNLYEVKIGFDIPAQVVQHETIPWARVSLDCFNLEKEFVGEIKYMGEADWLMLKEFGKVPDHYWPQVQYQLMVTGFKCLHFIGINKDRKITSTIVFPDVEYIQKIIRWCSHFWNKVETRSAPNYIPGDFKQLRVLKGQQLAEDLFDIDDKILRLFKIRALTQEKLSKIARSTRMAFNDKILINVSNFDQSDLSGILELSNDQREALGKSIKDELSFIILKKNNQIDGGLYGQSKRDKETTTRKIKKLGKS